MEKHVIRQSHDRIGITPAEKRNRFKYEESLIPIKMLLCECSYQFIDRINNCETPELIKLLLIELEEDKQTIISN